jgi:hypothetical protein
LHFFLLHVLETIRRYVIPDPNTFALLRIWKRGGWLHFHIQRHRRLRTKACGTMRCFVAWISIQESSGLSPSKLACDNVPPEFAKVF